jgi:hypothetical protein
MTESRISDALPFGGLHDWLFSEAGMATVLPTTLLVACIAAIGWCLHYVFTPNAVLLERELDRALETASEDAARARRIAEKVSRLAEEQKG